MPLVDTCSCFTITSVTTVVSLNLPFPSKASRSTTKDLVSFDFWSGNYDIVDKGITVQPVELHGIEIASSDEMYCCFPWCFPICFCDTFYQKFKDVHCMMDRNEEVTIAGIGDRFDAVYMIKTFSTRSMNMGNALEWSLALERIREA